MPNFFQQHGQGLGELMAGLGGLVGGVQHIRDPRKKEREEYMNLLQTNPELAQAVANNPAMLEAIKKKYGAKGNGMLDFLSKMPIDPGIVEKNRIQELQVRESVSNNLNDIGNAGKQINIPNFANVDPTRLPYQLSDQEKVILEEYRNKTTGQSTTAQRNEAATRQRVLNTQAEAGELELNNAKTDQTRLAEANKIVQDLTARHGSRDYYRLYKEGKIDASQLAAIQSVPEAAKALDFSRDEYWESERMNFAKESDRASRAQAATHRLDNLARDFMDRAQGAVTYQEAIEFTRNPDKLTRFMNMEAAPTNPTEARLYNAAQAMKRLRDFQSGRELRTATASLNRDAVRIRADYNSGKITAADAAQQLNDAAEINFAGVAYAAPVWDVETETRWGPLKDKDKLVLKSFDPAAPISGFDRPAKQANPQVISGFDVDGIAASGAPINDIQQSAIASGMEAGDVATLITAIEAARRKKK